MHMLICPHIVIAQFICMHRLCAPAIVPGGKCIYLLDYLQFDPLTSLPSTRASTYDQFQFYNCFISLSGEVLHVILC
jgi:hypothetical protein